MEINFSDILRFNLFDSPTNMENMLTHSISNSLEISWNEVEIEHHLRGSQEVSEHSHLEHIIGICLGKIKKYEKADGVYQKALYTFGSFNILPSGCPYWTAWQGELEYLSIAIQPKKILDFAPESVNPEKIEILPHFAQPEPDPLITGIAVTLKEELKNGVQQESILIENMVNALIAHLLYKYCAIKHKSKSPPNLSDTKLKLATEFIQDNLASDLTLARLASLLEISPHYFCEMFSQSIGQSPAQYILELRIARAQQLLDHQQDLTINEIAKKTGFNSASHLIRRYQQFTGVNLLQHWEVL